MSIADVLAEVVKIAPTLHLAGTFHPSALEAVVRHASARPIHRSVETGSGASTILFSHLSERHTVFAVDSGTGSISNVVRSPLFRGENVTFVEGPTQLTIPAHAFADNLQLALIDGPHGYPFPDLEYYYLYPHLDPGALLIVDDIQIPTIANLFEFLKLEEMFTFQEVVGTTAFFRRTDAPVFPTTEDGWWTQGYNKKVHDFGEPELELLTPPESRNAAPSGMFYLDRFGPIENPFEAPPPVVVTGGQPVLVSGWALDQESRQPAHAVDFVLDGVTFRSHMGKVRPDLADIFAEPAYVRSGFQGRLPATMMTAGRHKLEVRVVIRGGLKYHRVARMDFKVIQ